MAKSKKNKTSKKVYPKRAKDVPVTQHMLYSVKNELQEDIKSSEKRMDARFNEQDAKFSGIDARFNKIDARFDRLESQIHGIKSDVHEIKLLVEEQNARNRIVLDGLTNLFARQDRIEKKVDSL